MTMHTTLVEGVTIPADHITPMGVRITQDEADARPARRARPALPLGSTARAPRQARFVAPRLPVS